MFAQSKTPRLYLMTFAEALIFAVAYTAANFLRFEFVLTTRDFIHILYFLPWLISAKLAIFFAFFAVKADSKTRQRKNQYVSVLSDFAIQT